MKDLWNVQPPQTAGFVPIELSFTRQQAVIAGLMAAGYLAIANVAAGAVWEGETEIVIDPAFEPRARRQALVWTRAAENLQGDSPAAPQRSVL